MAAIQYIIDDYSWLQYGEFALRFLVACICGATIGFERSMRLKEAGVRTHLIVCCAAALVMIVSKYGFSDLGGETASALAGVRGADPARIAAQVISGVSFLGAGVIFHNGNAIKGLTTAAGLWATAGIGIALGSGMYVMGIFATIVITIMQLVIHRFTHVDTISTYHLRFTAKNTPEFKDNLHKYLNEQNAKVIESKVKFEEDGFATYNLTVRMNHEITLDEFDAFLEKGGEVKSLSCTSVNN